jgi:hypothetical protein
MQPTTHEPCLYSGIIDNFHVLFLHQVKDVDVACTITATTENLIQAIDDKMRIPVKRTSGKSHVSTEWTSIKHMITSK